MERVTHVVISIVPRAILVGTPKAWKKEVFPGSMPVFPAGTNTSRGATAPALAGAATFSARMTSRVLLRSALVNMNPTLPSSCQYQGTRIILYEGRTYL